MRRAVFLFNHDSAHQVAHLASVAGAMALRYGEAETVIAYSTDAVRARLTELIPERAQQRVTWHVLDLSWPMRAIGSFADRLLPASRLMRLFAHRSLFASADIVVSTERTCLQIKRFLPARRTPLFVRVPHGAGDRSVTYHPDYRRFDLILVAGQKVIDQLVAHGVQRQRVAIVGYPKFESVDLSARTDFFGNGKPTFVYNPHFDPHLSSWYDAGPKLLDWFARTEEGQRFNLIFAPHVMLFRKELHVSPEYKVARRRPDVPASAHGAANIRIDLDSPRLLDMSYMIGSDAYIGDVSSQIYEFLVEPRPAFFIDCRRRSDAADEERHLFWQAGPLHHSVDDLVRELPDFAAVGDRYRDAQKKLFEYTFSLSDKPASERAAEALAALIRTKDRALPSP